jgi:UDP-N-acetylglucosamine 2-epimerase (non-hydrolysing)
MPYTERSKDNLVREGVDRERIFVTGNPIYEVLSAYAKEIDATNILSRLNVRQRDYLLVTLHRAENVDESRRLQTFLSSLAEAGKEHKLPVLVSVHPRTADKIRQFELDTNGLRPLTPLGFFDFVHLEKNARAVLSDSGTVQEECAILAVPNVTLRDVTERPETIECGSNVLSGGSSDGVRRALHVALSTPSDWTAPSNYTVAHVSRTIAKIVLGYTSIRAHQCGS